MRPAVAVAVGLQCGVVASDFLRHIEVLDRWRAAPGGWRRPQ